MSEYFSRGQITILAKKICRINRVMSDACLLAEELSHDEMLQEILNADDKSMLEDLRRKVLKYTEIEEAVDTRACAAELDDATDLLTVIFYKD